MIVFFVQLLLLLYLLILQPIRCCKKNGGKKPGPMANKTNDNKVKKKRRSKEKVKEKKGSKEKVKKSKEKVEKKEEKPVAVEEQLKTEQTQEDDEEAKKEEEEKEPTLPPEQTQPATTRETESKASKRKPAQKFLIINMLGQKEEPPEAGYAKDGEEVLAAFNKMECEWDEKGGEAIVAITNKTNTKLAMKIKSSDNNLFRVRPVYSNIEPGKSADLYIYRSAGPIKNDRIVVVLAKNTTGDPAEKVYADKSIKTITTIIRQIGKGAKDNKAEGTLLQGSSKPSEKEQKKQEETAAKKADESGLGGAQAVKPPESKMQSIKIGVATVANINVMQCEWDDKGGRKTFTVSNTSNETLAMKIKCSDNNIFRIDPVFSNIEPGKSATVAIIRSAAPAKEDKVVVVLAKNILNVAPETVYKDKSIPTSTLTIPQKPIPK